MILAEKKTPVTIYGISFECVFLCIPDMVGYSHEMECISIWGFRFDIFTYLSSVDTNYWPVKQVGIHSILEAFLGSKGSVTNISRIPFCIQETIRNLSLRQLFVFTTLYHNTFERPHHMIFLLVFKDIKSVYIRFCYHFFVINNDLI